MEGAREQQHQTRKSPPGQTEPQKCPRCDSANTKFCYYNNYSLSQPRYYCKACRRYWTHGGTLRNVPVGGGCRKAKRAKTASSSSASSSAPAVVPPLPPVSADPAVSASQYSFAGGQFPSFASMQASFGHPQLLTAPGVSSTPSAMSLLQGFGDISGSFAAAQRDQLFVNVASNNQLGGFSRHGNDPVASTSSQQDIPWPPQSFGNYAPVWNIGPGSTDTSTSGPSLRPNQWPDLPRSYGSPPP